MIRLRRDDGQALISGLLVIAGVLVPLLLIVPVFSRLETAQLAAQQAARDAVRSAAQAPGPEQAQDAANDAVRRAQTTASAPLRLHLTGELVRGSTLRADVRADVPLADISGIADATTVTITATARAPVDRYRSLPP